MNGKRGIVWMLTAAMWLGAAWLLLTDEPAPANAQPVTASEIDVERSVDFPADI